MFLDDDILIRNFSFRSLFLQKRSIMRVFILILATISIASACLFSTAFAANGYASSDEIDPHAANSVTDLVDVTIPARIDVSTSPTSETVFKNVGTTEIINGYGADIAVKSILTTPAKGWAIADDDYIFQDLVRPIDTKRFSINYEIGGYSFNNDKTPVDQSPGSLISVGNAYIERGTTAEIDISGNVDLFSDNVKETMASMIIEYDVSQAFAVYSESDNSLDFYKRTSLPDVGSTFNGKAVTAVYTGIEKDVYESDGAMCPWYSIRSSVETSTVVDEISPLSTRYWFYEMTNLKSVDAKKLDTSKTLYMGYTFRLCSALTKIEGISEWDTSSVVMMPYIFSDCTSLENLDVSKWNTSRVDNMEYMFYNCQKLQSLDLSKWNTKSVKTFKYMFTWCSVISSVGDLTDWKTSNVADMSFMFAGCYQLRSVGNLGFWNTGNVADVSSMFQSCQSLEGNLDFSGWNTSKVSSMYRMFYDCQKIGTLNLCGWDTANAIESSEMFQNCMALTTIYAEPGADWSHISSDKSQNMFLSCNNLKGGMGTALFPNYIYDASYAKIDQGSGNPGYFTAKALKTYELKANISLSNISESISKNISKFVYSDEKAPEGTVFLDSNIFDADGDGAIVAWIDTDDPTQIIVSTQKNGQYAIAPTNGFTPFADIASNVVSADLSKIDTSNVQTMMGVFENCSNLENLDLSSWNVANVENITKAFYNCPKLQSIDLSGWALPKATDAISAFEGCASLETIYSGPSENWSTIANAGSMFYGCESLVGGNGTEYDSSRVSNEYAHIDNTSDSPGYFTPKFTIAYYNPATADFMEPILFKFGIKALITPSGYIGWDETANSKTVKFYPEQSITYDLNDIHDMVLYPVRDPDIEIPGTAFAIYSSTDNSLNFYKRENVPYVGNMFEGKRVTAVYEDVDFDTYTSDTQPWAYYNNIIKSVSVVDAGIAPRSTAFWFYNFQNCTSFDVARLETGSVTSMASMFNECHKLVDLEVSTWDTSSLVDANGMFFLCKSLVDINVSEWDIGKLENTSNMFSNCYSLTPPGAYKWETPALKNASGMFASCVSLQNLDLSKWDMSKVEDASYMFYWCTNLTNVKIPTSLSDAANTTAMKKYCGYTPEVGSAALAPDSDTDPNMVVQSISYTETRETMNRAAISNYSPPAQDALGKNPERGFYSTLPIKINENGLVGSVNVIESQASKLMYLKVDLSAFSGSMNGSGADKPLTSEAINALEQVVEQIKQNDNTVILRFVYDNGAASIIPGVSKCEPSQASLLNHITQLSNTFKKYASTINAIQVGFYGLWGEAFYNTDASDPASGPAMYRETIPALLNATSGTDITIAVRTYQYYSWCSGSLGADASRVVIFNDAYGASADDLGTYPDRESNIQSLSNQTGQAFYGGEAITDVTSSVAINGVGPFNTAMQFINEATDLHTSYINWEWNQLLHKEWTSQVYTGIDGLYSGDSALTYIENHLGYRFVVREAKTYELSGSGDKLPISIAIDNVGFGNVIKNKRADIVFADMSGNFVAQVEDVAIDAKAFKSHEVVRQRIEIDVPDGLPGGKYQVYLRLSNGEQLNNGKYHSAIRFANDDMWSESLQANCIATINMRGEAPKEVFAVYSATDNTLNFYNRSNKPEAGTANWDGEGHVATKVYTGFDTTAYWNTTDVPWTNERSLVKAVNVMDPGIKPTHTIYWFYEFTAMTVADLSGLDTSDTTWMTGMFAWCNYLTTIYVSDSWSTAKVTESQNMFASWNNVLVGGAGTRFVANQPQDASYAHVDGGTSNPGYFTYKAPVWERSAKSVNGSAFADGSDPAGNAFGADSEDGEDAAEAIDEDSNAASNANGNVGGNAGNTNDNAASTSNSAGDAGEHAGDVGEHTGNAANTAGATSASAANAAYINILCNLRASTYSSNAKNARNLATARILPLRNRVQIVETMPLCRI